MELSDLNDMEDMIMTLYIEENDRLPGLSFTMLKCSPLYTGFECDLSMREHAGSTRGTAPMGSH